MKHVRRAAMILGVLLVVEYLVLPQLAGARKSLHLLSQVHVAFLLLGVLVEVASLAAYAELTRAVLPKEKRPPRTTISRILLSTLAVSHVVPGGSAAGGALGYRLLTDTGMPGTDAGFALATQGLGSAVVLNVLLWLGLVISIPLQGFDPLYGTAAVLGIVLIGGFAALVLLLTRGEDRAANLLCRIANHLPKVEGNVVDRLVHRLADRLRELFADRGLLVRAISWAAANWLLDAASLWIFLGAFGHWVSPDALLVSYGLANVLAALPITPGGLGVVEGVLTTSLVGFGTPRGIAILGVIGWRLVNFWLPIPTGAVAYLSLKLGRDATTEKRAEELRRLAEEVRTINPR